MTLGELQRIFAIMVAKLIKFAYDAGYEITLGEAYVKKERKGKLKALKTDGDVIFVDEEHRENSNHYRKLAIDLNLFHNGEYLTKSIDHAELGTYWLNLGKMYKVPAVWGGEWDDGNHYSIEYKGIK